MIQKTQLPALQGGDMVRWFPQGNTGAKPIVAMALDDTHNGATDLMLFPHCDIKRAVYHVSDERLNKHTKVRITKGAWDHRNLVRGEGLPEKVSKVLSLAQDHSFEEVCRKVRYLKMSADEIKDIYEAEGLKIE